MPESYTEALIEQISSQLPDMDTAQVAAVLQTWQNVLDGDPVGTVRRNPDGRIAHRVTADGIYLWRVTAPDGDQYNDMQPTLAWEAIYTPEGDQ